MRPVLPLLGATLLAACVAVPTHFAGDVQPPVGTCTAPARDAAGHTSTMPVHWIVRSLAEDRDDLDEWCRGVGAPVVATGTGVPARMDSIPVITWNIHVGAARVDSLVRDLQRGVLTGSPAPHFVLLIQEARRIRGVPELPADGRGTRRLGAPDPDATMDIVETAARLGLHLFYVPSMRNGRSEHPPEDRGNAILSTLPLTGLSAIELPLLAQRRVAVAATVDLTDPAGRPRALRLTSVHLDIGATLAKPFAPFGAGRTLQTSALADALTSEVDVIVGGDFNTWSLERLEGGLALMRRGFPDLPAGTTEPTFHTGGFWPRRLDHLFLRGARVAGSAPVRIDDRYGSDHFPLITWVRAASTAAVRSAHR